MPIFDGQLSAIAAELENKDPEEIMLQVGTQACTAGSAPAAAGATMAVGDCARLRHLPAYNHRDRCL